MLGGGGSSDHTGQTGCVMGGGKGGQGEFLSPGSDADQDLDQDQTK